MPFLPPPIQWFSEVNPSVFRDPWGLELHLQPFYYLRHLVAGSHRSRTHLDDHDLGVGTARWSSTQILLLWQEKETGSPLLPLRMLRRASWGRSSYMEGCLTIRIGGRRSEPVEEVPGSIYLYAKQYGARGEHQPWQCLPPPCLRRRTLNPLLGQEQHASRKNTEGF